ncbi:MAG: FMN-binding glutamate synthase family protein [Planctomycetaceae bacterium]|nr:FMN-binding glutamate synthase family protein [Planctomycetaceae bacterium]
MSYWWAAIPVILILWVAYDLLQKQHAILHNFPIIGHFRYWLEMIGPELRQYIVTNNDEERPFSRDERRWVYASSKLENNYFGFGTDNDLESSPNYLIIRHSSFPKRFPVVGEEDYDPEYHIPCAKVLGAARDRKHAFRPSSIVNISAMSFGSLSGPAIEALNRGAELAGCLHNTGEGAISPHHLQRGELIWQIGTGYFGCRDEAGKFDIERFKDQAAAHPIRAIEIKLSQGAKPGHGGLLPAAKITPEIAAIRGIPLGRDCHSPCSHSAFSNVDELLDFVEWLAAESGLPVGIKSAVGQLGFWKELRDLMLETNRAVDFITIDGGEGGTGAAPLVLADHVALPFKLGIAAVYPYFRESGLHEKICFIGSGKLGLPENAFLSFALGCDMINVAREAMLALGCIQAQRCHSDTCPTGVATQNRWLTSGLDPTLKSIRVANYLKTLRKELMQLSCACGLDHPSQVTTDHFEILDECYTARSATQAFGYPAEGKPI